MTLKTHILISKSIHLLWISLLTYHFFSPYLHDVIVFQLSSVNQISIAQLWWPIFYLGIDIGIPLYFLYKSIFPFKKFKFKIIYPKISYHPFYLNYGINPEYSIDIDNFEGIYLAAIFNIIVILIGYNENWDKTLFVIILTWGFFWRYIEEQRNKDFTLLDRLPITIEVKYYSYLKELNEVNSPFLEIGQVFDCSINKIPRNKKEANTVFIYNNNHPNKNFLIAKIENIELSQWVKEGITLKAEIIDIKSYAKLHIKMGLGLRELV
jgi:hypothetical protein